MRLTVPALGLAIAGLAAQSASGFAPPHRQLTARALHNSAVLFQSTAAADCGCSDTTIFSGKPSQKALTINPRPALGSAPIYTVDGKQTSIDEHIGTTGSSIVVFLRSLG